jgi:hypothetical protein
LNLLKTNFYAIKKLICYLMQSLTKGRDKSQKYKSPPEAPACRQAGILLRRKNSKCKMQNDNLKLKIMDIGCPEDIRCP